MWRQLSSAIRRWDANRLKRKVQSALALQSAGEARSDGLVLQRMQARLELEWQARDIHPWDRSAPSGRHNSLFVKQCLADAAAVLARLFERLPHVESIEVRIVHPHSKSAIMEGLVRRSSLSMKRPLSDRMWLGYLGLRFYLSGDRFLPLDGKQEADAPQRLAANS